MVTVSAPATIDNTGKLEAAVNLSDWLATAKLNPDPEAPATERTLRLRRNGKGPGVYKVNAGVWGRRGETTRHHLDLNGCWLIHDEGPGENTPLPDGPWRQYLNRDWPRSRAVLHLERSTRLYSSRKSARITGGQRTPSFLGNWAMGCRWEEPFEAQHAVRVADQDCVVDATNIEMAWTYGDPVYVEWYAKNTEVKGVRNRDAAYHELGGHLKPSKSRFANHGQMWAPDLAPVAGLHHAGRQLLACSGDSNRGAGRDLWVHDITLWQGSRSCFDLEPGAGGILDGVRIERTVAGAFQNMWVAAFGYGEVSSVGLFDNLSVHRPMQIYCIDSHGTRRRKWLLDGNVAERKAFHGGPWDCLRFAHVDGIWIRNHHQYVDDNQAGRFLEAFDCTDVDADLSGFVLV